MFSAPPPDGAAGAVPVRKIIHCDMDAFFASVEQRDDPSLRGRPVAVGGSRERGVVAAASYEARKFGVRSAMPSAIARRRCPDLVFVKPRFDVYKAISLQIREVFAGHTALIEPVAMDEAYLDVTENIRGLPFARDVAAAIRAEILERTGLTASAGISYNKFLAKMASGLRKPDGQCVIAPADGPRFVERLEVARFHGVGERTAERLHALGIRTGADLRAKPLAFLQEHFGKAGAHFHAICRGVDERPVNPDRIRKSVGAETTFERDLRAVPDLLRELGPLADKAWAGSQRAGAVGRTVTLKVKYADFEQVTRRRTGPGPVPDRDALMEAASDLLRAMAPLPKGVRLIGVTLSGFDGQDEAQLSLAI